MFLLLLMFSPLFCCYPLANKHKVDLAHKIQEGIPNWPGIEKFTMNQFSEHYTEDNSFQIDNISTSTHVGTHVDAPKHFCETGWSIDQIPDERLSGPAVVVDIQNQTYDNASYALSVDDLEHWEAVNANIPNISFVLLRTGYGRYWNSPTKYLGQETEGSSQLRFPGFSKEAVKWLVDNRNILGVGIDTMSMDPGEDLNFPVHNYLLTQNRIGIENLANLEQLPATGIYLDIYPAILTNATGAPARVFAYVDKIMVLNVE